MSRPILSFLAAGTLLAASIPALAQERDRDSIENFGGGGVVGVSVGGVSGEAAEGSPEMQIQGTVGAEVSVTRIETDGGNEEFGDFRGQILFDGGVGANGAGFAGRLTLEQGGIVGRATGSLEENGCQALLGATWETDIEITSGEIRPALAPDIFARGGLFSLGGELGAICREGQKINALTAVLLLPVIPGPAFHGEAGVRFRHFTEGDVTIEAQSGIEVDYLDFGNSEDSSPVDVTFRSELRARIEAGERVAFVLYGQLDVPVLHEANDEVSGERVRVSEPDLALRSGVQAVIGF